MSSLKFKCGYCGWVVWFDKNGQMSHHPCLANHTELIMDKDRNLFINETHVESENNENNTTCVDDDDLIPIINDNSTSLSPVSPASSKSRKSKRIDLEKYDKVYEDEYDGISESLILTNIIENKYSKKRIRFIRKILLINKVNEWKRTQLSWLKEIRRRQLLKLFLLYQFLKKKEKKKENKPKLWVRSIFTEERRHRQGDSNNLINEMANDSLKYLEYLRMTKESFDKLLELLESRITKQHVVRTPISPSMRLQICLRYLASGDTMHSISFAFRVGLNTVSKIVAETCEAIWDVLKEKVFPEITENLWIQKAKEFELLWDFPNCIGAIDGKHVQIQAPPKSGSTFYNYKNMHSIVLMALADANCCFTVVDIGAEGRRSDGGILQDSVLRHLLEEKRLNIPRARLISDKGPELPYVIIGDETWLDGACVNGSGESALCDFSFVSGFKD